MEPGEIRLYQGTAPGSEGWTQHVNETFSVAWQTRVVSNVVDPTLTAFRPEPARSNGSAVIICPGGGFHALSIDSEGIEVARPLVARGTTAFVLKYRLVASSTADPGAEMMTKSRPEMDAACAPIVPLAMADGLAAMAYVRAHADDYGIDPERVGILGFSAGGMVAALPYCDALVSGHSFRALGEVVEAIGAESWDRAPMRARFPAPRPEDDGESESWASATPVPGSSVAMPSGYGPSRGNTTPGWAIEGGRR